MTTQNTAVVFAYSELGVRCLETLIANGIKVKLVVTHNDSVTENIWFNSVENIASLNRIPVIKPSDPNASLIISHIHSLEPDWIFSFYYRFLLKQRILDIPKHGAFNMHGSMLPHYRGRAPTNWAVLNGETQTGATLHRMELKPDSGSIIDQFAVPILPNDTAHQVYMKVSVAAELVLNRTIPSLLAGNASELPMDLEKGSYFGGRKPEDGLIDWRWPANRIHNLVRAVAPPYPGAFFDLNGDRIGISGSYFSNENAASTQPKIYIESEKIYADCCDGKRFCILGLTINNTTIEVSEFAAKFDNEVVPNQLIAG